MSYYARIDSMCFSECFHPYIHVSNACIHMQTKRYMYIYIFIYVCVRVCVCFRTVFFLILLAEICYPEKKRKCNAYSAMGVVIKMDPMNRFQILDEAVCVSLQKYRERQESTYCVLTIN